MGQLTPAEVADMVEADLVRRDADAAVQARAACVVAGSMGQRVSVEDVLGPAWLARALAREGGRRE